MDPRLYKRFEEAHSQWGDLYDVLGAKPGSTDEEVRQAFRRNALMWHPDRNKSPDAEERFKGINEAYDVLSKPTRAGYDEWRRVFGTAQRPYQQQARTPPSWQYGATAQRPRPSSASPADGLEARMAAVLSNEKTLLEAAAGLNGDDFLTLFDMVYEAQDQTIGTRSEDYRRGLDDFEARFGSILRNIR